MAIGRSRYSKSKGSKGNKKDDSPRPSKDNGRRMPRRLAFTMLFAPIALSLWGNLTAWKYRYTSEVETQYAWRPKEIDNYIDGLKRSIKRKVVLFGPHDRYNFGDLLFTKVLKRLLQTRAGYDKEDILFAGMISTDMTMYGGEKTILSMKRIQEMSINDTVRGPYDIVYTGGESGGCLTIECGITMLDEEMQDVAVQEMIYPCAYLVPKSLLVPESERNNPSNRAVVNSIGGGERARPACKKAIDTADHVAFRDGDPLYPDSAVMTKELYGKEIDAKAEVVLEELFPEQPQEYIAVQFHSRDWVDFEDLAKSLDEVSEQTDATIVFFAAGTAFYHDSFELYKNVSSYMKAPNIVYEEEHVWKVVGLISRAEAVLSTSLHVRIMASIFFKPRVTWCKEAKIGIFDSIRSVFGMPIVKIESKHEKFINLWDATDSPRCVRDVLLTWSVLGDYYGKNPRITQEMSKAFLGNTTEKYLESFDIWSAMLRRKP